MYNVFTFYMLLTCYSEVVKLIDLKITPRRGPHRKHLSSIVAPVFISVDCVYRSVA
jgi:hypothetical protein